MKLVTKIPKIYILLYTNNNVTEIHKYFFINAMFFRLIFMLDLIGVDILWQE